MTQQLVCHVSQCSKIQAKSPKSTVRSLYFHQDGSGVGHLHCLFLGEKSRRNPPVPHPRRNRVLIFLIIILPSILPAMKP